MQSTTGRSRSLLIITAGALLFAALACDAGAPAAPDASPAAESFELREHRAVVHDVAVQIDSIALFPAVTNTWAPAPGECSNGFPTGCPRINYSISAFVGGSFVGYVESRDWTSSNLSVATINNKGNADVIGAGTTTITVTYDHGRLTATATITAQ